MYAATRIKQNAVLNCCQNRYITDGVQPVSTAARTLMVSSPARKKYKVRFTLQHWHVLVRIMYVCS